MATVTLPSGETIIENGPEALAYYRSVGYAVQDEPADTVTFPRVYDEAEGGYVGETPEVPDPPAEANQQLADTTDALSDAVKAGANPEPTPSEPADEPPAETPVPVDASKPARNR